MSNWKYKLNLVDLRKKYEANELTIIQLAEKVANKLRDLKMDNKDSDFQKDLEDIANEFETCCNNVSDFDSILNELYDWGDIRLDIRNDIIADRLCWIGFAF